MRSEIRGFIEQTIDLYLSNKFLPKYQQMFKYLRPYVNSQEDAVFGCIFGVINSSIMDFCTRVFHEMTKNELEEVTKIFLRRIPEIRSRVMETLT